MEIQTHDVRAESDAGLEPQTPESEAGGLRSLYLHTRRPQWGLAILAQDRGSKLNYQFQDGRMRVIKKGFEHLLEAVDKPLDVALPIVDELEARVDRLGSGASRERPQLDVTFDDQTLLFAAAFPDGFEGADWRSAHRAPAEGRKSGKRHFDAAVHAARERLAKDRLDRLIAARDYDTVVEDAAAVLAMTTMVAPQARRRIQRLPDEARQEFAIALRGVLYGDGSDFNHFTRYAAVLSPESGKPARWSLVTALPALVHPDEHVCVKPSVFRDQALCMAPSLRYEKVPTAGLYERFRKMAFEVAARLDEAGQTPRDLLDVRAFIWNTLRPKARARLDEARRLAAESDEVELGEALLDAA